MDRPTETRTIVAFRSQVGEFEIIRELGRGSMGIVFEAVHKPLGRRVALKTFQAAGRSPEALERFRREAAAAARLAHPGIVPVWAVGEDEGTHYYAMELVEGRTLRETIRTEKIPFERAARIAKGVAEALDYAHERGVIHRDVKPANIIITQDDRPVITDFGLAKDLAASGLTQSGVVLGTPTHMSPEQARGEPDIDRRADIYGLGACLYEMLTLRLPFYGENLEELLQKVEHEEPERPRKLNPKIPKDLEAVALRCLEKRREDRFASAREVADELDRFLRGERVRVRTRGPFGRAWRWAGKHRTPAALAAALVTALLSAVGGKLARDVSARREVSKLLEEAARAEAQHDAAGALVLVRRALSIDPKDGRALERRGALEAMRLREAEEQRRARNRREAEELVERGHRAAELGERLAGLESEKAFGEALDAFGAALGLDPQNVAARVGRGRIFLRRALEAERRGEAELAEVYFALVRDHNPDGFFDAALRNEGTLAIRTRPEGARVSIDRVLPAVSTGEARRESLFVGLASPVAPRTLPAGSYVVEVDAEGFAPATVPVRIERNSREELDVRLLRPEDIPSGFVYVPAGPFLLGGDPIAIRSLPRARIELHGFLIARDEVTCQEFAEFLSAIPPAEAKPLLPRGGARQKYATLFWPVEGRYRYPPSWPPERPVTGVTFEAASRYAAWRARRDGLRIRLPTEIEWEKACRGADGRAFAWGSGPPEGRAHVATGAEPLAPRPVGSMLGDVSVYGVRDMIGNAAEWTSSLLDERRIHRIVRGGACVPQTDSPRAAARFPTDALDAPEHVGIRLACDLPE